LFWRDLKKPEAVVFGFAGAAEPFALVLVVLVAVNFFSAVGGAPFLEVPGAGPVFVLLEPDAAGLLPSPTAAFLVTFAPVLRSSSLLRLVPVLTLLLASLLVAVPLPIVFSFSLARAEAEEEAAKRAAFCFSCFSLAFSSLAFSSLSFLAIVAERSLALFVIA
jgi:hypothetical protein